jgi:hypothetical protein
LLAAAAAALAMSTSHQAKPVLPERVSPEPEPEPELGPEPGCRRVLLFGGAMSSEIGTRFADVSTFRQVPDAQEVFIDTVGEGSLTLELLERY